MLIWFCTDKPSADSLYKNRTKFRKFTAAAAVFYKNKSKKAPAAMSVRLLSQVKTFFC